MADFGHFWKNFPREREQGWPTPVWFTGNESFVRQLAPGDRLWLFTSGRHCGLQAESSGYLVQIMPIHGIETNTEDSPDYDPDLFRYVICGADEGCIRVDPPLLIDSIIYPGRMDPSQAIGSALSWPCPLSRTMLLGLLECLRRERPDLAARLPGEAP